MGTLFGAFTGGYLTDAYAAWDARRHGGMFRPESRLPLLIIPGLLVPTGLLMFGYGATQHWHWAILFVANGFINVGITAVASIGMVYVSDSYFPVAHEALLMINGLKNVVAFGYSYGVTPWIVRAGFEQVCSILPLPVNAVLLDVLTCTTAIWNPCWNLLGNVARCGRLLHIWRAYQTSVCKVEDHLLFSRS